MWCDVQAVALAATVTEYDDGTDMQTLTNSTGDYDLEAVPALDGYVRFDFTDYLTGTYELDAPDDFECGEDEVVDCEMPCMVTITTTLYVSDTDQQDLSLLTNAAVDYEVAGVADLKGADCDFAAFERSTKSDGNGLVTMNVPLLEEVLTYEVGPVSQLIEPRTFTKTVMAEGGGVLPGPVPLFALGDGGDNQKRHPFEDDDCAWNPEADRSKEITPTILCSYGVFVGEVKINSNGAEGYTVTATRVEDGRQWTDTTNANGHYLITVPTGVWNDKDSTFRVQVEGYSWVEHEFVGCGQQFSHDFDL
jgi:hypothetical protein